MFVQTLTLKFDTAAGQFDDAALQEFLKDKEVLSLCKYFFIRHDMPYLTVFLTYLPKTARPALSWKKKSTDWQELLSEAQLPLFNRLRSWRAERAKAEAVPVYFLLKNRQLAQIAANRPTTLDELGKIHGIGKAKLARYGNEILAILGTADSRAQEPKQGDAKQTEPQTSLFDTRADGPAKGSSASGKDGEAA